MKPRTIILLVVAVVCGLAAMYMTNRLLADKGTPPPANTVKVLVTKKKVDAWVPIKKPDDLFELKDVPEGTYSPKCITDFKQLQDKALRRSLDEQMPVVPDDLLSAETSGLIGSLKEGQRAVALKVTPESLAGGFVLPGSKVDVMFIKKRGDVDSETQIILQDMLVLAVDMKNTRQEGETAMLGSTATLAATPEEAEQLALASALGDLRLLLRTPLDRTNPKYKPITMPDLARQRRVDDQNKLDAAEADAAANGNGAGTVPTLPKADKAPTPAPEKVADKTPPPPPVTHVMKIVTGETVTRVKFVWDKENSCWEGDETAKRSDGSKPEDAAKPADAGKPEDAPKPQKAPAGDLEKNAPVG